MPTRASGIFHLDYDNFNDDVAEKVPLFKKDSTEDLFLDALSGIIQNTYLAADEIICYVDILNMIELTQIEVQIPNFSSKHFPDDKKFAEITGHKNALTEKLVNLMNKLTPVNEINKNLWTMLKDDMNSNTKINSTIFKQLKTVGQDITSYTKLFEKTFKDFPMPKLMKHFNAVTEVTEDLKYGKALPTEAVKDCNRIATALDKTVPDMIKKVDFALKLNYDALFKAQKSFRDIAMKALNVQIFFGDFSCKN